ncbi:PREDICTED: interleukin-36 beta-like [Miniopterus natalensis]|uniref:interleukin-36 beta-like n=1 Tax=Miniopterus natalensis TaxID=291302 RepID=UPI0007A6A733|nr:PREDICTED: interleukin-36 beta-like [Miniopterus natalensis]
MATTQKVQEPVCHSIRDSQQMVWSLNENLSLIAVYSTNSVTPVTICSVPCTDPKVHDEKKGIPIYMGIKGKDLCLFCAEAGGKPTLQLKETNVMDLYKSDKAQEPFLFLRNIEGSTSSFQSFTYPGWFIATASEEGQPVTLTNERGKTYNTNFYFDPEQHMPCNRTNHPSLPVLGHVGKDTCRDLLGTHPCANLEVRGSCSRGNLHQWGMGRLFFSGSYSCDVKS